MATAWRRFVLDAFSPSIGGPSHAGAADSSAAAAAIQDELGGPLRCGLFVRLLGAVYLCAFASLWPQLPGLVGSSGVLPAAPFLGAVATQLGAQRLWRLPTLLWLGCSDGALQLCCGIGIAGAILVLCGRLWWPALAVLWACYLSLVSVGREFMTFQWDTLLLEAGLLTLLLVPLPGRGLPWWRAAPRFVPVGRWLLLWLLFRLLLGAGWVKLRSGDPTWRDLSALNYHFQTQPLPTWLAYYAHRLPSGLKRLSVLGMFVIELGGPVLLAAGAGLGLVPRGQRVWRRLSILCWALLTGLMGLIAATGNYGFFNLLTASLGVLLLPDDWLRRVLSRKPASDAGLTLASFKGAAVRGVCAGFLLLLSGGQALTLFMRRSELPAPLSKLIARTEPFHLSSRYGLFAVMTTTRPEIIIEGSRDGKTWLPYEFKYKPGDLQRAPRWAAPHQPRLDWQMWFAALGPAQESPWLQGLCIRLLQGKPEVLWLLARDPFAGRPPQYLRALIYPYRFTTATERAATGAYWHRDETGPGGPSPLFLGPVSLSE